MSSNSFEVGIYFLEYKLAEATLASLQLSGSEKRARAPDPISIPPVTPVRRLDLTAAPLPVLHRNPLPVEVVSKPPPKTVVQVLPQRNISVVPKTPKANQSQKPLPKAQIVSLTNIKSKGVSVHLLISLKVLGKEEEPATLKRKTTTPVSQRTPKKTKANRLNQLPTVTSENISCCTDPPSGLMVQSNSALD